MEKEVSYFDIEAWGKLAESVYAQGRKGRGCRVVGRLRQDRWDGDDGKKHSRVKIVADHIEYRPSLYDQATDYTEEEIASFAEVPPEEEGIEEPVEATA